MLLSSGKPLSGAPPSTPERAMNSDTAEANLIVREPALQRELCDLKAAMILNVA